MLGAGVGDDVGSCAITIRFGFNRGIGNGHHLMSLYDGVWHNRSYVLHCIIRSPMTLLSSLLRDVACSCGSGLAELIVRLRRHCTIEWGQVNDPLRAH